MLARLAGFGRYKRILLVLCLDLIVFKIIKVLFSIRYIFGGDARSYIAAAKAIAQGLDPYNLHETVRMGPYLYPPFLAILFIPLENFSILTGSYICVALSLLTAISLVIVLHYFVGWKIAIASIILFPHAWHTVYLGQVNLLIATLVGVFFLCLMKNKVYAMGIPLALGTLIKVTPLLNVYVLLLNRYYKGIVSYAITIAAVFLWTLFFVQPGAWLTGVTAALSQSDTFPEFISWTGMLSHYLGGIGNSIGVIVTLSFLVATLVRVARIPMHFAVSACTLLPLLIARITWDHHLVMVLPVFALLWYKEADLRKPIVCAWLLLALCDGVFLPIVVTLCWVGCCWPDLLPAFLARCKARVAA